MWKSMVKSAGCHVGDSYNQTNKNSVTPGGTRTRNLQLRRLTPYPLGYGGFVRLCRLPGRMAIISDSMVMIETLSTTLYTDETNFNYVTKMIFSFIIYSAFNICRQ